MNRCWVVVLVVLGCAGCDSGTKYRFATYSDAKADKTILGASIPEFVPSSARQIVGWYHVETNQQTTEFSFASSDLNRIVSSFSELGDSTSVCSIDSLHSWNWSDIRKSSKFRFYSRKMPDGPFDCLSIDTDRSRAYYWVAATH
jgi:hypothetical protein